MQYHVVYLVAGERRTARVEAADAAGALARLPDRGAARFELLAVLRTDFPAPSYRCTVAHDGSAPSRRDRHLG